MNQLKQTKQNKAHTNGLVQERRNSSENGFIGNGSLAILDHILKS